jgi:hypothetical protein
MAGLFITSAFSNAKIFYNWCVQFLKTFEAGIREKRKQLWNISTT